MVNASLFTVLVEFEDRSVAIEQITAEESRVALELAIRQSEALSAFDLGDIADLISKRLRVNQVAGLRGVWTWYQVPEEGAPLAEVFGGAIIQTDENGPVRG